jgi:hypothetical protein
MAADTMTVRELGRDEDDRLDAIMAAMSSQRRYLRFHTPITALSPPLRRALLDVDGVRLFALVAEAGPGRPVGTASVYPMPVTFLPVSIGCPWW